MKRRGYSLVEIVFSISWLSLIFMAVVNLLPASSLTVLRAGQEVQAVALAQSLLEQARAQPFSTLAVGTSTDLPEVSVDGTAYRPNQAVYSVPGEDPTMLKGIRITVKWTHQKIAHQAVVEGWICNVPR